MRCLAKTGLKIGVCWMLTQDDRKGHGELRTYLAKPRIWRNYDSELYDALQKVAGPEVPRTVRYAHEWRLIHGGTYFTELLSDQMSARDVYFKNAFTTLASTDLIFFDPDVGLEVPSTHRGARGSARYVYWSELSETFGKGHSVMLYQHFRRVNHERFVPSLADRLSRELGSAQVSAFVTSHVVFFLVAQSRHRAAVLAAAATVRSEWHGQIEVWPDSNNAAKQRVALNAGAGERQ